MSKSKPLPEEFKTLCTYNKETGEIFRRGRLCEGKFTTGYIRIYFNYRAYCGHRVAWLLATGSDPGEMLIDHINGIKNDNRFCNLRLVGARDNTINREKFRSGNLLIGTKFYKGGGTKVWQARIFINKKFKSLGYFKTQEEASAKYWEYKNELEKKS